MSLPRSTLLDALAGSIVDAADLACDLRRQTHDRDLDEIGIAEIPRAIEVGAAHRFDLQVQGRRGQQPLRLEVVRLEDVQHLDQRHAAGADRRHRDDLVAAIEAAQRRALPGLVLRQILSRDQAAVRFHVVGDAIRDPAFVEDVGAVRGDRAERLAEIGEHHPVALAPLAATRLAVRGDRGREVGHPAGELAVEAARETGRQRESLLGEQDAGHHDVLPRQLAELPVRARQPADGAGHARREIPRPRQADVDLAVGAEIHRPRRLERGLLTIVERRHAAARRCGRS